MVSLWQAACGNKERRTMLFVYRPVIFYLGGAFYL